MSIDLTSDVDLTPPKGQTTSCKYCLCLFCDGKFGKQQEISTDCGSDAVRSN